MDLIIYIYYNNWKLKGAREQWVVLWRDIQYGRRTQYLFILSEISTLEKR